MSRIKYKTPVNYYNDCFETRHSKTIKDKFFLYNNKISIMLPAAIIQRNGNTYDIKVLELQNGEHVSLHKEATGSFNEIVELCAKHFNLK